MPLYLKECLPDTGITYAIWKIEEKEDELISPLSDKEFLHQQAYRHFSSPARRLEWLSVRRLFHEIGYNPTDIMYHPTGRPFLSGNNPHISISHTKGYAAIALQEDCPVGIDIEQIGDKVCRVRSQFLSHQETAAITSDEHLIENLLIRWSAKETMFKLIDREGIDFSEHLKIHPFTVSADGNIQGECRFKRNSHTFHIHYRIFPDFVLTAACHRQ